MRGQIQSVKKPQLSSTAIRLPSSTWPKSGCAALQLCYHGALTEAFVFGNKCVWVCCAVCMCVQNHCEGFLLSACAEVLMNKLRCVSFYNSPLSLCAVRLLLHPLEPMLSSDLCNRKAQCQWAIRLLKHNYSLMASKRLRTMGIVAIHSQCMG